MKINELQIRQGRVELTATLIEKGNAREFDKFGKKGKVCDGVLEDETGRVKFTLWNEQADEVNAGDVVKVSNGWVGEYQGEKQLSTGKFGKLEVVKKGNGTSNTTNSSTSASVKTQVYKPGPKSSVLSAGSKDKPKQFEDEVQDYNNDSDSYEESFENSKPDEEFIE